MNWLPVISFFFACFQFSAEKGIYRLMDGRIVGGKETDIETYPYQLSLRRFKAHSCGAALLNESIAITAAHCTDKVNPRWLSVRAGSSFRSNGGVIVNVRKIIQNSGFKMSQIDYDASLLVLDPPLNFSDKIQPISLPELDESLPVGSPVTVTGWGTNSSYGGYLPNRLLEVQVFIVSMKQCRKCYKEAAITDRMICAGFDAGGKDACQGDSGGPLVYNSTLYGLVSWGLGCADPKYPGVYTNICSIREWIYENTGL